MLPAKKDKILVVDDEEILRFLISTKLEEAGFEVETASNGVDSLQKLPTFQPDLIILDINMPLMDGISTAVEIRKDKSFSRVPIIFLTGAGSTESLRTGFEAGADEFLFKPINADELLIRIHALLRMHKAEVEAENLSRNFHYLLVQDFLNYSTAVKLPLTMLLEESLGPLNEQQKEIINLAIKALDENIKLLQETALITKMDPAKIAISRQPKNFIRILNENIEKLNHLIKKKNITLIKNIPSDEISVELDEEHIRQTLFLLLNFIVERVPSKGDIHLGVMLNDNDSGKQNILEFYVKVSAETISDEELNLLIDRYEQAKLNKISMGKNLSLTICKLIIEAHNGKFWCESKEDGHYFKFSIPINSNHNLKI
ncbi:MAG: DNA-binding response regulator KdpE [Ignavibacteriae bacterium]|nr:MAG: DNA-binding response regulator KdpE [Ignavibacteriota bacterium]